MGGEGELILMGGDVEPMITGDGGGGGGEGDGRERGELVTRPPTRPGDRWDLIEGDEREEECDDAELRDDERDDDERDDDELRRDEEEPRDDDELRGAE